MKKTFLFYLCASVSGGIVAAVTDTFYGSDTAHVVMMCWVVVAIVLGIKYKWVDGF